ncbi:alpha/beta fold hydrolase [Gloeocapsopsis crepidinum LEGE 06123]|uniref:Alpha/beta fold hydrolase n=1 Tax=Gloeocapsopsis crepidinum LEGE 06123 TaxID=588587 RepID=A0ABR9UNT2_9CHRO|nr:alpha/beta fold hydrolase [Gloeocapsopsis crepidinum]MBE9189936.1 alpha/beta fold hydrolase [Gloeocapsopsis crepidinum LEGE 06123]
MNTENQIKVGSLEWFYRETKPSQSLDKPPVLLLHGIPAQSYIWTAIMPTLAEKGFRAIAPDWIGFGFSAKPDRRDFAYTPDAFVTAFAALIEALEIPRFSLVVQGFLGSVGLQYALRHPQQIERLAILNAPVSPSAKLPWKLKQLGLPFMGDMLTQDPLLVDRTLESGSRYQIGEKELNVYRKPFLTSSAAGRSLLATVRNLQLQPSLAEIASGLQQWQQPTMVIWGVKDPWLSITDVQDTVESLNNVELVQIPEAGHYPQEHWSEKVGDLLQLFLRRAT